MTVTALHPATAFPAAPEVAAPVARTPDVVYVPAPEGAPTDLPRVFTAINSVMRDAMPVGKNQRNTQQNYAFRGIDDVMSAMAGPLRTHGVFLLPSIVAAKQERDGKMTRTLITMQYRVYGPAGDCLVAEVPGEASDFADKSMNKAQSAALKYFLFALFMLPVDGRSIDDGDRDHPTQDGADDKPKRNNRRRATDRAEQPAERQQQAPAGPSRDYLAEAVAASSEEAFTAALDAARTDGAPGPYLSMLDDIGEAHRAADVAAVRKLHKALTEKGAPAEHLARIAEIGARKPGARQRQQPPAAPASGSATPEQAEERLRIAASRAHLTTVDADFQQVYGVPIDQATAQQLDTFRARIEVAEGQQ
jgi:ERF superfamily